MSRKIVYLIIFLFVLGGATLASLGVGYYAYREQIEPIYGIGERIIVSGRRQLGLPTETTAMVDRIETTYLTLRGKTYLMPNQQFRNGGGLALWGEQVLVLHSSGMIMALDENRGLSLTDLQVPENNLEAYVALAVSDYPDQSSKDDAVRYNDLEYIDTEVFNGLLISYTYIDVDNACYQNRISKLQISDEISSIFDLMATPEDWELVYKSEPCLPFNESRELVVGYMAGGRIAFKEPNLLYLGNGEFHREGFYRPDAGIQSNDSDYGKTIEINLATGASRHFSKGHRNLQGVTLDAEGRLWTTEHGMRGGDELNLIIDQENYGWPLENLGTLYSGAPAPTEGQVGRHEIYRAPVYAWLPSAAVSSLALIDGFDETWNGDLLIGSLRGRTLYRARIKDDRIIFLENIPIGQRIRDVMQVGAQKLALWLDTEEVVILTIETRTDPLAGLEDKLVATGMDPTLAATVQDTLVACNECHSFEENVHGAGPSLYNVADRDIASTAFANYSLALQAKSGAWDRETLVAYLTTPENFAPSTTMSGQGVGDAELARAISDAFTQLQATAAPEF